MFVTVFLETLMLSQNTNTCNEEKEPLIKKTPESTRKRKVVARVLRTVGALFAMFLNVTSCKSVQ